MNTQIANNSEKHFNLSAEPEKCVVKDDSHLEKFAHQMFSELNNNFSSTDRLEVFNFFRAMVKERNEEEIRELSFHIDKQKSLSERLSSFIF